MKLTDNQRDVLIMLYINDMCRHARLPEKYSGRQLHGNTVNSLRSKGLVHLSRLTTSGYQAIDDSMNQKAEKRFAEILHKKHWTEYAHANHERLVAEIKKIVGNVSLDFFPALGSCSWKFAMHYDRYSVERQRGNQHYSVFVEAMLDDVSEVPELNEWIGKLIQVKALLDNEIEAADRWIQAKQQPE